MAYSARQFTIAGLNPHLIRSYRNEQISSVVVTVFDLDIRYDTIEEFNVDSKAEYTAYT